MSYTKRSGKDVSVFVTKEDISKPEVVTSLSQDEAMGIVLPSGELNWDCPCLGGMAYGPCGQEFKDAFSCFHYSEEEEKGSDCIPQFKSMQECFQKYPEVYSKYSDDEEEEHESSEKGQTEDSSSSPSQEEQLGGREETPSQTEPQDKSSVTG